MIYKNNNTETIRHINNLKSLNLTKSQQIRFCQIFSLHFSQTNHEPMLKLRGKDE